MGKWFVCGLAVLTILLGSTGRAKADPVIWDYSPGGLGLPLYSYIGVAHTSFESSALSANLAERFFFSGYAHVTGMDIYGYPGDNKLGQDTMIRLYADSSGRPGQLLTSFTGPISVMDNAGAGSSGTLRAHVDFSSPLNLLPNTTYWIGMSGRDRELSLTEIKAPAQLGGDGSMAGFDGTHFANILTFSGDMAFRLEGSVSTTPEPGSLALLTIGALGLAGHAWRKRRRSRITSSAPCTAAAPAPDRVP